MIKKKKPFKRVYTLSDHGDTAIDETVEHMYRLAKAECKDPVIVALAEKNKGTTQLKTIRNLFNWVVANITYELDPPVETIRYPTRTILDKKGDCDCMSTLLGALFCALGIKYKIKVIAHRKHAYTHVYLMVDSGLDFWIPIDPVLQIFGQEKGKIIRRKVY